MLNFSKRGENDARKLVDQLEDIFSLPDSADLDKSAEREAWRHAQSVLEAKRTAHSEVARRFPSEAVPPPELVNAQSALERAQIECVEKQRAHSAAVERRAHEFAALVHRKLTAAGPALGAIAQLLAHAVAPLEALHSCALRNGLPLPSSLEGVPLLARAARELTMLANSADPGAARK